MDTPETKPDIVFNDDARKLPDGTINLTGQWLAIQTVSLPASLVNSAGDADALADGLQAALKAHIEERLDMDSGSFAYLAPITVAQLPRSAMADQFGATAFIVRTSLVSAKDGEYFALDVLEAEHQEESSASVYAGNFKRVEVAGHGACWLLESGMIEASVAEVVADSVDNGADMGLKQPEESAVSSSPDAPASPPNAIQVIIEFDPATQGFTCGVVQNGVPIENLNPYAVLQMLNQFSDNLIANCGAQHDQLAQKLREKDGDGNQSRIVVANASTPLPPMPRMKQRRGRN